MMMLIILLRLHHQKQKQTQENDEDVTVRNVLNEMRQGESGAALPVVLILLLLGSLVLIPTLNYVSTGLKESEIHEKNIEGLYAADAGVEDALWRLSNNGTGTMPDSFQLTNINDMTVDVTIDEVATIAGEDMGTSGTHDDFVIITKTITYDAGIYDYQMTLSNNGSGNVKIEKILIDFPANLDYVDGSTGGDLTNEEPNVIGTPGSGETLVWIESSPFPSIPTGAVKDHTFQLSGPPGIAGVEGHGVLRVTRQDVGTVWDSTSHPYSILVQAKDASNNIVTTIKAGVWSGVGYVEISDWQINQ
jgi:hypothetical protein